MRILAIDDDPTILEIIELFLETLGYSDIHVAPSADHATRQMERHTEAFDLILLDVNMPGMSGISLLRQVMEHPLHRHARIVMLSALGDARHIEDAFISGAFDYIVKPFELPELEHVVKRIEAFSKPDPKGTEPSTIREQAFAMENCISRLPKTALTVVSLTPVPEGPAAQARMAELYAGVERALANRRCMMCHLPDGSVAVLSFGSQTSAQELGQAAKDAVEGLLRSNTQAGVAHVDTQVLCCTQERGRPEMLSLLRSKNGR